MGILRRAAIAGVASVALGCRASREAVPPLVVESVTGEHVAPLDTPDARAICLLFVAPDCPISNVYAPEIERIASAYAPRRVSTFLVYSDPAFDAEDVRRHCEEYRLSAAALLDPEGRLARFCGATVTPEAAVWSPERGLAYLGRIDDLYVDLGKKRAQASERDLRNALEAVLAGQRAPVERTQAIGCFLPASPSAHEAGTAAGHGHP
jgi:hypothetical protein